MFDVVVLLGAQIEMQAAYERSFHLETPEQLEARVQAGLAQLAQHPFSGSKYLGKFRRLVVSRSNYGLFYVVELSRVFVHAFLDLRTDPEMILRRLCL